MTKSQIISRVIPAPTRIVEAYLASPGGLLRLMQSENVRRLPPRGSTLAQQFELEPITLDGAGSEAKSGVSGPSTLARVVLSGSIAKPASVRKAERQLERLGRDCGRLHEYAMLPQRMVMTGSNGLIGSALLPLLVAGGHQVTRLVRGGLKARGGAGSGIGLAGREEVWQPQGQGSSALDPAVLDGADCVIHLAGEPVSGGRWSKRKLVAIRDSRVESTRLLARATQQVKVPPRLMICASGIHAYGDRGDEELTERSDIGSGYLAEVVRDWEAAAEPAREAGVRVVHLRWGLVLSAQSGALREMLPLFRLGLGAIPSPGTQWWPWVSLDDAAAQALCVMHTPWIAGPVNGVAPLPARASDFCRELARAVDRPLLARMPRWLLGGVFGGQEEAICTSTRAMPGVLRHAQFRWGQESLHEALGWELL